MRKLIAVLLAVTVLFAFCGCNKRYKYTIAFDKGDAKIIAHRGLSGLKIENTKDAFMSAAERSYWGIEADLRRTADGQFIICHDQTLTRISKSNLNVEESQLQDLLKIPLSIKNRGGEGKLCELSTYISICKAYKKQAILELKSDFSQEEIAKIIDQINLIGYIDGVTFISFNYLNLERVRHILPNQACQYLFSDVSTEIINKLIRDRIDVALSYKALTEERLIAFHNAGLKVNCWTVDDKKVAQRLASLGVDYITTNILE